MLFNSAAFLLFFPLVTLLYWLLPHRFRYVLLLVASCIFYAYFIPSYLLILFLLIGIDYTMAILMDHTKHRKALLIVSILSNLFVLGIFKYHDFFVQNINELTGSSFLLYHWILPIGLSFHTFQSISYVVEVYRRKQPVVHHAGYYALYVLYYPQLVAGPIERPQHLFPQLFAKKSFSMSMLYNGLRLMAWGLFKKVVIADRVGQLADEVFRNHAINNPATIWLGVLAFTIQIYADFSGYSDMAIGASNCMGIDLCTNFARPYQSTNIRAFWQRWHISLSGWFRDYVYIPLGGNRHGSAKRSRNLIITFLLSGFWHGANWTFMAWGGLHGLYVMVYEQIQSARKKISFPAIAGWMFTFAAVAFAWIFFRANSMHHAFDMISKGHGFEHFSITSILTIPGNRSVFGNISLLLSLLFISWMFVVEKFSSPKMKEMEHKPAFDMTVMVLTCLAIIFFGVFEKQSFIYFQF